jgi:hypothetical protein
MPGFTIGTADRGSVPFLGQPWLIDDTFLVDQPMGLFTWYGILNGWVGVNRTDISDARTLGATFVLPVDPSVASGESLTAAPGDQATQPWNSLSPRADFYLKRFLHRAIASRALQLQFSDPNDMIAWQLATAKKALWYEFCRVFYTGTGGGRDDREFLGLDALATGTQRITGSGSLANDIDSGLSRLRPPDPVAAQDATMIIMNSVTAALYAQQLRAAGVGLEYCHHPVLGRWWCHRGIPIGISNFVPEDAIPQPAVFNTRIFLVVFGRQHDGVYGIYKADAGTHGIVVQTGTLDMNRDAQFLELSATWGSVLGSRSCLVAIDETGLTTPTPLT